MKKVYLEPVRQHEFTFYIGKYDPRKLVKMTDQNLAPGTLQEAQRPLDAKHLREIASYVGGEKGLLPASVMIATHEREKLVLEEETSEDGQKKYFMQFPETDDELANYGNTIDIIDGQHRVFSFRDDFISPEIKASDIYDMPFSLFITPDLTTRQLLFTMTNEKQKAVSQTLLLYLKAQLHMLDTAQERYLPLVTLLNKETKSPLKGCIIMSAERIKGGFKADQVVRILDKFKIGETRVNNAILPDDKLLDAISIYLDGWEEFYGKKFSAYPKITMTKISGFRYIMGLFPLFFENAISRVQKFDKSYIKNTIQDLEDAKSLGENDTLLGNSSDFRGETATFKLVEKDIATLKSYLSSKATDGFDPLA